MDSQNELFALCKKTGGTYMAYELRPYQKECKDILDKNLSLAVSAMKHPKAGWIKIPMQERKGIIT